MKKITLLLILLFAANLIQADEHDKICKHIDKFYKKICNAIEKGEQKQANRLWREARTKFRNFSSKQRKKITKQWIKASSFNKAIVIIRQAHKNEKKYVKRIDCKTLRKGHKIYYSKKIHHGKRLTRIKGFRVHHRNSTYEEEDIFYGKGVKHHAVTKRIRKKDVTTYLREVTSQGKIIRVREGKILHFPNKTEDSSVLKNAQGKIIQTYKGFVLKQGLVTRKGHTILFHDSGKTRTMKEDIVKKPNVINFVRHVTHRNGQTSYHHGTIVKKHNKTFKITHSKHANGKKYKTTEVTFKVKHKTISKEETRDQRGKLVRFKQTTRIKKGNHLIIHVLMKGKWGKWKSKHYKRKNNK